MEKFIKVTAPVVLTIDVYSDEHNNLVISLLKNALKEVEQSLEDNPYPEDAKYDKKLIKAIKRVLDYYGEF